MLTKEIREAITAESSAEYIRLLHNYGIWSRYFGCSGYPGHTSSNQTYTISDESAMIIDKAFCELKQKQPNLYKLLNMFYIQCKSPDEIFLILKKQITIRDRVVIQEGFNLNTMSGLVVMLRYVIRGTFLVEGVGALCYSIQFVPEFGLLRGIWYSVFHSVSAFCNAGVDLLGETSLEVYQRNPLINVTTMALIVVSGIGFIVWQDVVLTLKRILKCRGRNAVGTEDRTTESPLSIRRCLQKMKLQSKLAIIMTLVLLFGGALAIFCMEYSNPDTLGSLSLGEKWMAAMFQSVTTRTAGFFTVPQNLLREETRLLSCVMMFIGGSPGGTAGGVCAVSATGTGGRMDPFSLLIPREIIDVHWTNYDSELFRCDLVICRFLRSFRRTIMIDRASVDYQFCRCTLLYSS